MTLAQAIGNLSPMYEFKIMTDGNCLYSSESDKQREHLHLIMTKYASCEVTTDIKVEFLFFIKGDKQHGT